MSDLPIRQSTQVEMHRIELVFVGPESKIQWREFIFGAALEGPHFLGVLE